ncbi:BTAD domain-containing putative transcriptional regulator [Nonomuraea sp. NPDC049400]|uniref:AfsR/SARP family transcriptional regulator n=1 Tax=Nonomuraea sp. NPDC049400 TaxID=3364352 RepID=UPI0037958105
MKFRLLGPLRVEDGGSPTVITAPKQRTVLAMLLARAGHVVPIRSLVAEVWDDQPPRSAVANLRTYLMRLRKLVPPAADPAVERLVTSDAGYLLRVEPEEFDLFQFEALSAHGRQALARRDLSAALDAYTRALALWQGMPAEDVPLGPTLREVVARLSDHYLSVVEEHAEIQLALGRYATVASRLREVIGQYPLRERLYGQLMVALYQSGDVVGALDAFGAARRVLADELGIDPGPDLRRLQQSILRRDSTLLSEEPVDDGRPRPRQLPRAPTVFVGRSAELARIHTVLNADAGPPVLALHGPGGVGKSTLALKAAYRVADRYPDGHLYVDLQGSTPGLSPLRSAEVLGRFLRALGVPPGEVPAVPAEAAALYQSLLADRRVLVVLDNAVGAAQVAPLLPAGGGCAALVTSRTALTTLDAVPIAVELLDEEQSVRMLALLAGQGRVAAEAEAAAEIARWCCRHPLALRIAGARLAGRPDWSLASFNERLGNQQRRLDELQAADLRLRSCFEVGYATLTSTARTAFRLFGVLEVPEVGVELTAALVDADQKAAEAALDELVEARLIEPVGKSRFRMHDLLRLFAAELAAAHDPPKELALAVGRALDWYLGLCHQLRDLLQPHLRSGGESRQSRRDPGLVLGDPAAAVRWLDVELRCLVAAAVQAARGEPDVARFAIELMTLVKAMAMKSGYWRELETIARLAIEVARRDGDRAAEAATLATLGLLEWRAGQVEEADNLLRRAPGLWRDLGEREEEGMALHNLGWLRMQTGDLSAALGHISASLRLLKAHGSKRVGLVSHNLGEVLLQLGRYTEAADRFERCLTVRKADRDLPGESITLAALGRAYCLLDHRDKALAALDEALARCEQTGNREDEWEVLLSRSEIRLRDGAPAAAEADLARALELTTQIGDAYGYAACTRQLARARTAAGDPRAVEDARRAEELFADPAMRRNPVLERLLTAQV